MTEQIRVCIRKQRQVLTSSAHSKLKRKKFSHLYNGPLAVGTTRREELMVVFVTVRPSLSLKEACGAQLHLTGSTHKVFRVPHFTQSCDHLQNREKKQVQWKREEVCICFIFFLIIIIQISEPTILQCLSVCLIYLSHNAFIAGSTVALGCGAYTNLLQVRAQPS